MSKQMVHIVTTGIGDNKRASLFLIAFVIYRADFNNKLYRA